MTRTRGSPLSLWLITACIRTIRDASLRPMCVWVCDGDGGFGGIAQGESGRACAMVGLGCTAGRFILDQLLLPVMGERLLRSGRLRSVWRLLRMGGRRVV